MNTKKILTALFAGVVAGAALTVSTMAADVTVTTEAELKAALETANNGDTITVDGAIALSEALVINDGVTLVAPDVTGKFTSADGATITINAPKADLTAGGDLTLADENTVNSFSLSYYNNTLTIGEDATLAVIGTGRVTVGWGNTFIIKGNISDAKNVDKEDITPSLYVAAGLSITGSGANFGVEDAYVSFGNSVTSKNSAATNVFNISFENSIADFANNFSFATSTNGMKPTFNITIEDSVMNLSSNFDLSNEACDVVIDNSDVTVASSFRNDGKLDIINGSNFEVLSQIQPGEHGGHSGTITVDNSALTIECSSTHHAYDGLGKGVLIAKNGAEVDIDYIKDSAVLTYGEDTSVTTAENGILGDTEVVAEAVASVNGEYFTDLATAFKSVSEKATIEILSDITIDAAWQCNFGRGFDVGTFNNNEVTIIGNDHTIKFTGKLTDGNTMAVISTKAPITVKNLTFDLSECPSYLRVISARTSAVIDNCTFIGNPANTGTTYAVIVGERGDELLADTTLTVTESDFINFKYGVSDNRNDQDVKSVSVTGSTFTNAKVLLSAKEDLTFSNNAVSGAGVTITSYSDVTTLAVTANGNTLDETATNYINAKEIVTDSDIFDLPAADINGKRFITIGSALAAANENDVITVLPGRYTEKLVLTKNVVITGDPNYGTTGAALSAEIEKPVIVISEVADGGVKYQATDVTFDNIVFEVAEDATRTGGYYACALGYFVEDNKTRNTLTVTNCDFINHSSVSGLIAIMAHIPNYTVTDCTFTNFSTGIYTALDNSEMGNVDVSDNTYANVPELYTGYWGKENAAASLVINNNKASDDSTTVINVYDYVKQTVGADATAYGTFAVTNNGAKVVLTNVTKDFAANVTGNDEVVYTYKSETLMRDLDGKLPNGTVYVAYGADDQQMFIVENGYVKTEATSVSLTFEENNDDATALDNSVWDIYLNANQGGILNRLNSADFTFEITTDGKDAMAYEICATNDEIVINNVNNDANRYEFHYDGKTGTITDTATKIKLGTVKFTGYGAFTFSVDTTEVAENTNQVHATTFVDSIVDSFTVKGEIAVADDNGDLVVNGDNGIINSEIIVPTKVLTINIDFPNSVSDNAVAYQQMKVVVSGGELEAPLTIDLGTDYVVSELDIYDNKANAEVTVTKNNPYAIVITNLLEVNTAYNVEVSGEGYRTAKYTVTMTEDKTLNFWNNVKDNAVNVEEKKDSSAKNVTFLAGDIVKDSVINIYDLSAVVSYFGEIDLVEDGMTQYAKYDLNRDGKIDSKDVAYVLVSWGK